MAIFDYAFLLLVFSPGLRGLGLAYYSVVVASFFLSSFFSDILKGNLRIKRLTKGSLPLYIIALILLLSYASFLPTILGPILVDTSMLLSAFARLAIPSIVIIYALASFRNNYMPILYISAFSAALLAALSVLIQFLSGSSWEFLSSESAIRSGLARYASTSGSLISMNVFIPFVFVIHRFYGSLFISDLKASSKHLYLFFSSIPRTLTLVLLIVPLLLSLSRTGFISVLIALFFCFLCPPLIYVFLRKAISVEFSKRKFLLTLSASIAFLWPLLILLTNNQQLAVVLLSFLGVGNILGLQQSSTIDFNSNLISDFTERVFWADPQSFDIPGIFIGQGIHRAATNLGFDLPDNPMMHNTFSDYLNIMGFFGPVLVLILLLSLVAILLVPFAGCINLSRNPDSFALKSFDLARDRKQLLRQEISFLAFCAFILFYLSVTLLSISCVFYIPAWCIGVYSISYVFDR